MNQRDDVERSLQRQDGREAREVYAKRTLRRAGWRARLAHVEFMLTTAQGWLVKDSDHGHVQGRACLEDALVAVREMLDEMPAQG